MKQRFLFFVPLICIVLTTSCNSSENKAKSESTNEDTSAKKEPATENKPANLDATVVAADHYKLLKDTAGLRIIEINYKAGESAAMHSHPEQAIYVLEGGKVELTDMKGKKDTFDFKAGVAGLFPSATHSGKNIGTTDFKAVLVEINRPNKPGTGWDETLDATKIAPKEYKKVADTAGVRIIEISYKPGEFSKMHSHPDAAFYATSDGTAEFTRKDGSKATMESKKGMGMYTPADTHSVKNVGKTTMKGILVEVNRASQ